MKPQLTAAQQAEKRMHANLNHGRDIDKHLNKKRTNHSKLAPALRLLYHGSSCKDIRDETGISDGALRRLITSLRLPVSERILYISGWELHGKCYQPVYKIGEQWDKGRPQPMTQAEKSKRHRDKMRAIKLNQLMASPTQREN